MPVPTPTPADDEASVGAEDEAGSQFGNEEAITSVMFSTPAPNPNPAQPDFKTEGKVFDNVVVTMSPAPQTSKSVSLLYSQGQFFLTTINLFYTSTGSLQVQAMLDESTATWYNEGSPVAVAANTLVQFTTQALVRQRRLVFTPAGNGTLNAWITSI